LLGILARPEPAAAFSFSLTVTPLPICMPTKSKAFCSLQFAAINNFPVIPAPLAVRMKISVTSAFVATAAVGSSWSCAINPGGAVATCTYTGPKPIPVNFKFPAITVRARAKVVSAPIFVAVCATIEAFSGNTPQPFAGHGCANVQIVP
jgi:polyferredoxin